MTDRVPVDEAVAGYVRFYQELRPDTVARLDRLAVPDVHFKDPFNEFRSRDRMKQVFLSMFQRVEQPRFIVRDHAVSGQTAYLRWGFSFRARRQPQPWTIEGMSEVRFDHAGQVVSHVDHWDAAGQLYERLPLLGWLMATLRRHLAD